MRERNIQIAVGFIPLAFGTYLVLANGASWWWVVGFAAFGVALVWFMLRRGRHTPWSRASSQVAPGHAVVFWKPGCTYCERLLRAVGNDKRITWVNVWQDEAANAEVRRHNNGDELTPTALVGSTVLRNPSAAELLAALG